MEIRRMVKDDIPQLAGLYKQFWHENSRIDKMYNQFTKLAKNGSYVLLSAVENGCLIGSVMGVICEELYGDCLPFMVAENMIVDRCHRRKGIGTALLFELERIARKNECSQIALVTDAGRTDARSFYEAAGYNPDTHKGFKKKLKHEE